MLIIYLTIIMAIVGIMMDIKAKKILNKGLSESDTYKMVIEFNRSRRYLKTGTILLVASIVGAIISIISILIQKQ